MANQPRLYCYEMLKNSQTLLLPCIQRISNAVLQQGIYPKGWKVGYINPIFKSGDRLDQSNYRRSTILSCIGKLFNSVLNRRLDKYLSEYKIISKTQIGFQKKISDNRPYVCIANIN